MHSAVFLLFLAAAAATACLCIAQDKFAYLLFSQQWSTGYCRSAFQDRCLKQNMRRFWTIHGLWPSSNTSSPDFCNRTLRYNATVLKPLFKQLQLYWPSYTTNNSNLFWKHEWQKHGTCATSVSQLDGLYNFFNTTLLLYKQHNLTDYLYNSGIVPSEDKTYSVAEIEEALTDDLKGATNLVCYRTKNLTAPVLSEIRLCLDKELKAINCTTRHSGCGRKDIYYLPFNSGNASMAAGQSRAWHFFSYTVLFAFITPYCFRHFS
ncbi:ribonuclease Oy-like [Ornithodoros turicata]|uniref:ribonuclease Oy-like n=1 Tax=Ornithodoros turicata TaxID=34597 RepID=UPI0031399131